MRRGGQHQHRGLVAVAVSLVMSVCLIWASASVASTSVAGSLSGSQTWTKAGSPYTLVDNATVSSGSSLTIEPGVQVNSTGRYTLNLVGRLRAVGTPADPIDISLGSGLTFFNGSLGSEVAWATVRDSIDFGITTKLDAQNLYAPWPSVHDVEFRNNSYAVYPWYPTQGSASVTNARFTGNDFGIMGVGANLSFDRVSVEATGSDSAYLSNNPGQNWTISRSNLYPPTQHAGCDANRGCNVYVSGGGYSITATGVWWGTTDPFEINRRIHDGNDDPSKSIVQKDPVATAPYDLYAPQSAIGTPATLRPDAGTISGTATDPGAASSGVTSVTASFQDLTTGLWWNGTAWVGTEQFLTTIGTTTWQLTIPTLIDGRAYRARSLARDNDANSQFGATTRSFVADGTPPTAPVIGSPADNSVTGSSSVTVAGTAEANSSVEVFDGATSKGTTSVDAGGNWSKSVAGLSDGTHAFTARATDAAGNTSAASSGRTVRVDTQAPTAPVSPNPAPTPNPTPSPTGSTTPGGSASPSGTTTPCTGLTASALSECQRKEQIKRELAACNLKSGQARKDCTRQVNDRRACDRLAGQKKKDCAAYARQRASCDRLKGAKQRDCIRRAVALKRCYTFTAKKRAACVTAANKIGRAKK